MKKSMLLIDATENCEDCELMFEIGYSYSCGAGFFKKDISEYMKHHTKPEWCPLQDVFVGLFEPSFRYVDADRCMYENEEDLKESGVSLDEVTPVCIVN